MSMGHRSSGLPGLLLVCGIAALFGCRGESRPAMRFGSGESALAVSAAFSHDGKLLVALTEQGAVRVWDVKSGNELARAHISPARRWPGYTLDGAAFAPHASAVAFAGAGGDVYLWHWRQGAQPQLLSTLPVPARQLAFSSDGSALAIAGGGMEPIGAQPPTTAPRLLAMHVRLVETESGRVISEITDESCGALAVTLSADAERAAVTCLSADGQPLRSIAPQQDIDARVILYDLRRGRQLRTIDGAGHVLPVLSSDGHYLLAGQTVWDTHTGKPVLDVPSNSITFADQDRRILGLDWGIGVGWELKATRQWVRPFHVDLQTGHRSSGRLIIVPRSTQIPPRPAFCPDRRCFVDYRLNLWKLRP